MFYSFFVGFLLIASFQAFPSEDCRSSFFLTPLEEMELSPETVNSLQNKAVKAFSDLLTEEEKELTERGQVKSLLNRLKEALALLVHPPINIEEIQSIFSLKANYAKYKGQKGYLLFVERTPNTNSMDYVFKLFSKALGEDFKELGWQQYQGSTEAFYKEQGQILNSAGRVKEEYKGMSGYARYAEKYHGKAMKKAFVNVSAVLESSLFEELGWQGYQGSTEAFYKEQGQILNSAGRVKEEYKGMSGYARYAEKYHGGNMKKAFVNVSAVLGGYWGMKEIGLDWKKFRGSVSEYYNLLQLFEVNRVMDFEGPRRAEEKLRKRFLEGIKKELI